MHCDDKFVTEMHSVSVSAINSIALFCKYFMHAQHSTPGISLRHCSNRPYDGKPFWYFVTFISDLEFKDKCIRVQSLNDCKTFDLIPET